MSFGQAVSPELPLRLNLTPVLLLRITILVIFTLFNVNLQSGLLLKFRQRMHKMLSPADMQDWSDASFLPLADSVVEVEDE
jgi:hypothetical protein